MPQLDPLEIIAKVQGEAEIARLEKEISKAAETIESLSAKMRAAGSQGGVFRDQMNSVAASMAHNMERVRELKSNLPNLGSEFQNIGRGALQASYFIDDLQYGLKAVVNNIPQLVLAIGGGAGLAGVLGIAAVAVNVLANHWDDLMAKIGASKDKWIDVKDQVQELSRTLDELREKRLVGAGSSAASGIKAGREGHAKIFEAAMKAYGPEQLEREMAQRAYDEYIKGAKSIEGAAGVAVEPGHENEAHNEAVKILNERALKQAQAQIGAGARGEVGTSFIATSMFGKAFGKAFKDASEDAFQAWKDKEDELNAKMEDDATERIKKEKREREQLVDKLNKQGEENEEATRRQEFEQKKLDDQHRLRAQIKAMHQLHEENQEAMRHVGRSEILSAEEYSRRVTQAGFDSIPNQQLKVQKDIKIAIDKLHDKLGKVNEMRFKKD